MRLPLLILHILAGSIGLLTGTVAFNLDRRKCLDRVHAGIFLVFSPVG
jgi:hypothetical protein